MPIRLDDVTVLWPAQIEEKGGKGVGQVKRRVSKQGETRPSKATIPPGSLFPDDQFRAQNKNHKKTRRVNGRPAGVVVRRREEPTRNVGGGWD